MKKKERFSVSMGDQGFPGYRIAVIFIGIVAFFCLWWLIDKTRIGAMIRAGMDDKEMAMGLGINHGLIYSVVFALGTLAG